MHAAKCIFKLVNTIIVVLSEIQRVFRYVPHIAATFGIALIELTSVIFYALALDFSTIVKLKVLGFSAGIQAVDMLATLARWFTTEFCAGDGRNRRTCIDYEGLRLPVSAKVHRDVIVHEIGRVAIQRSRMQFHVHHVSTVDR